jgi:hypothetical protein
MQKLLEYLKTKEQISLLLSALRNLTLPLTKCSTGQFLLTRCFTLFSGEDNKVRKGNGPYTFGVQQWYNNKTH